MSSLPAHWSKQMLICLFLGISSGLPLYILLLLISAWLKSENLDLTTIGLFGLVGFPYTWKFIWAPLIDRFHIPLLGRRRGWMLITQILLTFSLIVVGSFSPRTDLTSIVFLCGTIAFLSASQDTVIDAYRSEMLNDWNQGSGNAVFANAYRLAQLVPGSLSLILSDYISWQWVFFITALFMIPGILTTILINEPTIYGIPPKNLREAIISPLSEFIFRRGISHALLIILFIFFYKLGSSMTTTLSTPFYMELGFSKTQIGLIARHSSLLAGLSGVLVGSIWLTKIGINRGLWIFGILQSFSILGFVVLGYLGNGVSSLMLATVIGITSFCASLSTAAFLAFISITVDIRYTATQFAILASVAAIPRTFLSSMTGFIVDATGWPIFFIICFLLTIPGISLLRKVAPFDQFIRRDSSECG